MKRIIEKGFSAINWRVKRFENFYIKCSDYLHEKYFYSKSLTGLKKNISNWNHSLLDPTGYYYDMHRYFFKGLASEVVEHKNYFKLNLRGFGEDAFHSMWVLVFKKYNINKFLEIGIYRGQVMSLLGLIARLNNTKIEIYGIAPFDNSGDVNSRYIDINYEKDIIDNFDHFGLPHPILVKAYSTDKAAQILIESSLWDCIYIDGSHDYNIVKQDWELCSKNIRKGGIIVLDDAALYTNFINPTYAFKGHPGPSKVADEILNDTFKEVLRVGHNRIFEKII